MVVEGYREGLGLAYQRQHTPEVARRKERLVQGESEVDPLLARGARLRQMWEGAERLLEVFRRLAVGRPRHGLLPRLPAVCQGFVPYLPSQSMVGQPLDLLSDPVPSEPFHGFDDTGMQRSPPL